MGAVVHPAILYAALVIGALGVALALPRPRVSPQVIGAVLGIGALAGLLVSMALKAGDQSPGAYFYVFSVIALGSGLRVISHPRPVYAALYFIITILSSAALYLMLEAEFLAFALIIIYAGAILITYLFVIMLAEQGPSEDDLEGMATYDRFSREPAIASGVGFALLAALSVMLLRGVGESEIQPLNPSGQSSVLAQMPKKVIASLDRRGVFDGFAEPELSDVADRVDFQARTIRLVVDDPAALAESAGRSDFGRLVIGERALEQIAGGGVQEGRELTIRLPDDLRQENIDEVGFELIAGHPMALELAGVILLMAMLGAVVLARKQIEIGESEKEAAARNRAPSNGAGGASALAGDPSEGGAG